MTRGDEPAFPVTKAVYDIVGGFYRGMTKREYMATKFTASLLDRVPEGQLTRSMGEAVAETALDVADTLLAALAKEEAKAK